MADQRKFSTFASALRNLCRQQAVILRSKELIINIKLD